MVHILETSFKQQLVCNFAIMEHSFFILFKDPDYIHNVKYVYWYRLCVDQS